MKKNGKKIALIILIIVVLIIAGLGTALFFLMKNETIAITKEQKLNRGMKKISKNIEQYMQFEKIENLENIYKKADKNTTTITAQANEFEMKYFDGYPKIIEEIRGMINDAEIQNIIEKDLDNKIINQKFSLKVGNVIKSLTEEAIFHEDEMAIKIDELSDKYLLVKYNDEKLFDEIEKNLENQISIDDIKLTDSENKYFLDNYKEIIINNITTDMITEASATISINGKEIKCSEVYVTLNKTQIISILEQILQKLENDETGKSIILSKLKKINSENSETDLENMLYYLKYSLNKIDDSINLKIKMYSDILNTYGFAVEISTQTSKQTINYFFEDNYNFIELKEGENSFNITIKNGISEINLNSIYLENRISFKYSEEKGIGEGTLSIIDVNNNKSVKILINTDFSNLDDLKIKLRVQYYDDNNNIDITFNIENVTENVDTINKKQFYNTNSIDISSANSEDVKEYIDTIFNNINKLLENAAENSKLISVYYNYYSEDISKEMETLKAGTDIALFKQTNKQTLDSIEDYYSSQAIQIFNQQFIGYEGKQKGTTVKTLYQTIQISNEIETSGHTVLWNCSYSFDEIENSKVYTITLDYDNEGYVNKVTIE